jgi:hypothetical protein
MLGSATANAALAINATTNASPSCRVVETSRRVVETSTQR